MQLVVGENRGRALLAHVNVLTGFAACYTGDIHDEVLEDYGVEGGAVLVAEVDEVGIEERFVAIATMMAISTTVAGSDT